MTNERIKAAVEVLEGVAVTGRFYWLRALVLLGELTEAEAGFIIVYHPELFLEVK